MDRLDMMRCFVAVADQGSFTAAARRLGLSTSSLTRHVAALEDRFGAMLLRRTTRAVSLTDAGARFLDPARRMLADFDEASAAVEGDGAEPSGRLVVTAPVVFGRMHLGPLLGRYALMHRRLEVDLRLSDGIASLVEDGIDAAIRIGHLADSGDIAVKVGSVRRVLVGAPDYLATAPRLAAPEDLAAHRLIGFRALTPAGQWAFPGPAGRKPLRPVPAFTTDSADVAIDHACRSGGLTLALSYQVADLLRSGKLVRLLPECEPPAVPVSFVTRERRLLPARVRGLLTLIRSDADWTFA